MSRMTNQNLYNIKRMVEKQTGVEFQPTKPTVAVKKIFILAAAILSCFVLAAFSYPMFTPLDGDELTLSATYEGSGIVCIYVENGSDKDLKFQKKTKLYSWVPDVEIPQLEGDVSFENTVFPAHSDGFMTVDLSRAYDIGALEAGGEKGVSYYLLLTNHDFLFGHDWMCSFSCDDRRKELEIEDTHQAFSAESLEQIEEDLRFYFEDSYQDQVLGLNDVNFVYLQKVDEMIKRFEGKVIQPVYPTMMVGGPSTFLEPQPVIKTDTAWMDAEWSVMDGYHRLVGAAASEKAYTVNVNVPVRNFPQGVAAIPVLYLFFYETGSFTAEDHTFIYGQFRSFQELEHCKIFEDQYYTVFDMTEYFYTDLEAYLKDMQMIRQDLVIDEKAKSQIRDLYNQFRKNVAQQIEYLEAE